MQYLKGLSAAIFLKYSFRSLGSPRCLVLPGTPAHIVDLFTPFLLIVIEFHCVLGEMTGIYKYYLTRY